MEFRRMFSNPMDPNNCFLDIQAGSGGTEAQDWAQMLERMYLRYCERKGFTRRAARGVARRSRRHQERDAQGHRRLRLRPPAHRDRRAPPGAQIAVRLQRRRHTSFASVFVYPEVDETIEIEINPADLRIDTFRASGAGGQHVNKTDSAIRITHLPTSIVVQCQNDRSQHRNRAEAMAMLKSKLYELELRKRQEEKQALEDTKTDIGWGHQIRSYVLDQSRIKDLRTNVEIGNTQAVLDGDLDDFIEASLKQRSPVVDRTTTRARRGTPREAEGAARAGASPFPTTSGASTSPPTWPPATAGSQRGARCATRSRSTIAGRMMLKRVMGKASFATIQDMSGAIQIYVTDSDTGQEAHEAFKHCDLGDIVGVEGELFKTRTGELTVRAPHAAAAGQVAAAAAGEIPRPGRPGAASTASATSTSSSTRRRGACSCCARASCRRSASSCSASGSSKSRRR